ncbi:chromosomal replication initiator protein DnaA [Lactobacillus sp. S2-2]|uniref:chromosomal replication initiator protein DnaA n=1 Tax=Lactobacillus sp. S2-2 TaxID=2692917 RepID=UPI001F00C334|nr:chromosomal replication initiator protein DnaA [Lactobacillus sp. S2-2]
MDHNELWQQIKEKFKEDYNQTTYSTWIETAIPISLVNNELTIQLPTPLHRDYWKTKFSDKLVEYAYATNKIDIVPVFVLEDELKKDKTQETSNNKNVDTTPTYMKKTHLNSDYTFDTFVIGKGNQMAHAAALVVSEEPGKMYNPLFFYGGVGLGKTHLMHAIGNKLLNVNNDYNIKYVTSEAFTNDFINAIQTNRTEEFRKEYRSVDLLLVDDIQFFADKEGTQEEFFHTFNDLYEDGKQIVLTSDRLPNEIPKLQDRLVSRFAWGLSVDITPPDLETRTAILRAKAESDHMEIPSDTLSYIAGQIDSNVRELEGALSSVQAFARLRSQPITTELVSAALRPLKLAKAKKALTVPDILKRVSSYFHVTINELKGKKRIKSIVVPRQIAMYLSRELTESSLPKIGEEFGGKDHTTVIHAYEKIVEALKTDSELQRTIDDLKNEMQH